MGLVICQHVGVNERGVPGLFNIPLDTVLIWQDYVPIVAGALAMLCFRPQRNHWSEDATNRTFYSALLVSLLIVGCLTHINGVWYLEFPARMRLTSLIYGVDID
jgi:hypothetical protein